MRHFFIVRLLIGSAAALLATGSTVASASGLNVYERTDYYDISGRSARELLDEMAEKGPESQYSITEALGATHSYFNWYVEFENADGLCVITDASVTLDLTYFMPRWTDKEKGSRKLRATWEKFLASLWIHERGHGEISRRGANAILEHIVEVPSESECETMKARINELARQIQKDVINPAQRKYDKLTRDGQTQGAGL